MLSMLPRNKTSLRMSCCLAAIVLWLSGCTVVGELPAVKLQLTAGEASRLGAAVTPRLLQLLGGPYHDRQLAADLKRLATAAGGSRGLDVYVADRSDPALYVLPGGKTVLTRGLLAGVQGGEELKALLAHAGNGYAGEMTHSMVAAARELGAGAGDRFDPDAADVRLASGFVDRPCAGFCLAMIRAGRAGGAAVPDSVRRLGDLQPGYDLLARAQEIEAAGHDGRAIALMLQAAGDTPDEPLLLGALGMAYLRAGQLQQARLHLQKSVRLQPEYYRTQMGLGYLLLQLKRYDDARDALKKSVALLPVAENLFLLGEVLEKSGDAAGAAEFYRRVARHDGRSKLGREARERLARLEQRQ